LDTLRDGLAAYALAPGRTARLAELLPADAAAQQAWRDAHAAALAAKLRQADKALDSLVYDLGNLSTDPADTATQAMRARIHAHFAQKHAEREKADAELTALGNDTGHSTVDLLDDLPELATRRADLPTHIQAALFAAFEIQVLWNPPLKQATFHAAITTPPPASSPHSWPAPATTRRPPPRTLTPARPPARSLSPAGTTPPAPAHFRVWHVSLCAGKPTRFAGRAGIITRSRHPGARGSQSAATCWASFSRSGPAFAMHDAASGSMSVRA
jgi:hypothetical protein